MERPARRPAPPLVRHADTSSPQGGNLGSGAGRPRAHVQVFAAGGANAYPGRPPIGPERRPPLLVANLRRNVCPHFYMTGSRGALPVHAPHLLKALSRQETTTSRCQLRGGVHLEQGYVSDVCLSARFNQCVFYEDELSRRD